MGQSNSVESNPNGTILESFTKEQLTNLFKVRCSLLLREVEAKSLTSKLNIKSLHQTALTPGDLGGLLGVPESLPEGHPIERTIRLLYESFKVLGSLPFLSDVWGKTTELTVDDLIKANLIHSGRYKKILSNNFDYLKIVFVSLALADTGTTESSVEVKGKSHSQESISNDPQVIELARSLTGEEPPEALARIIKWDTFNILSNFDDMDFNSLKLKASDVLSIITFFLILSSIPKQNHLKMRESLSNNLKRWPEFETCALAMMRFFNLSINSTNITSKFISYEEYHSGFATFPQFLPDSFGKLFIRGIFSSIDEKHLPQEFSKEENSETTPKKKASFPKFKETRLISDPSISLINTVIKTLGPDTEITNQNLVKLYLGSESGFSIRSLESKIFKWQAPTLFIVSGKRLKNKTITTNKRYEQFNNEYPRFFKSSDNSKLNWQSDNDKITYAVLVKQPWRHSNKKNFGDEDTAIISLSPRLDFFKSAHNPVLNGESIYFNNSGLGLGFGNSQPVSKAGVKKYLPGDVSLTIEMNLEFAVFRHIVGLKTNAATYFKGSGQPELQHSDFEDRFMITDLEVWGIGSTKELEEQRKQWEWEEKQAEARQSVNLKNLGEERAFLEMVGLVGNHNSSGGSI